MLQGFSGFLTKVTCILFQATFQKKWQNIVYFIIVRSKSYDLIMYQTCQDLKYRYLLLFKNFPPNTGTVLRLQHYKFMHGSE